MSQARGFRSKRCAVCSLPVAICMCTQLQMAKSEIPVVLLRHPKEAMRPSGTGFLALHCIQTCELLLPENLDNFFAQNAGKNLVLLFPPDGAEAMPETQSACTQAPPTKNLTLLVPDGSWQEARRMVRKHAYLRSLPRVSPQMLTRWIDNPLRRDRWKRPCTAEAVGQWLQEQGQVSVAEALRVSLCAFVTAHWNARGVMAKQNTGNADLQTLLDDAAHDP